MYNKQRYALSNHGRERKVGGNKLDSARTGGGTEGQEIEQKYIPPGMRNLIYPLHVLRYQGNVRLPEPSWYDFSQNAQRMEGR